MVLSRTSFPFRTRYQWLMLLLIILNSSAEFYFTKSNFGRERFSDLYFDLIYPSDCLYFLAQFNVSAVFSYIPRSSFHDVPIASFLTHNAFGSSLFIF